MSVPYESEVQSLVKNINESQSMSLNKNDIIFVALIAGLQISRQWLNRKKILNRKRFNNDQESAEAVKHNRFMRDVVAKRGYGEWILGPTSYDAIGRTSAYWKKTTISGNNHRYTTLAHDPLIGLLVGPINLLSNTITYNTTTTGIKTSKVLPNDYNNPATGYSISGPTFFSMAVSDALYETKIDYKMLAAAVLKHLIHLASDINTTQGLIIPGLSVLPSVGSIDAQGINRWLIGNKFDSIWFMDLFAQYGIAEFINTISSIMYKFLLYHDTDKSDDFVNAKCKKVIAIANALSSSEDLILATIRALNGDPIGAIRDLDWGGLMATIKRIRESDEFKKEIKSIDSTWDDLSFNFQYSIQDINEDFQQKINQIDKKYQKIIMNMKSEYENYSHLQAMAANLNQPGIDSFGASIEFAKLNKVNNFLKNKEDIDGFFNN